jgi:DNA topoisomerase-1
LTLPPESEEVAGFFGAMLETDHARDEKFRANFFRDFKDMVAKYPPVSAGLSYRSGAMADFVRKKAQKSRISPNAISSQCSSTLRRSVKRKSR